MFFRVLCECWIFIFSPNKIKKHITLKTFSFLILFFCFCSFFQKNKKIQFIGKHRNKQLIQWLNSKITVRPQRWLRQERTRKKKRFPYCAHSKCVINIYGISVQIFLLWVKEVSSVNPRKIRRFIHLIVGWRIRNGMIADWFWLFD